MDRDKEMKIICVENWSGGISSGSMLEYSLYII